MDDFNLLPEADRYLLLLLFSADSSETVRGMAGLILKNNLRRREGLEGETIMFMREREEELWTLLGDKMGLVRSTVGTLLASVVVRVGKSLCSIWPSLLPSLLQLAFNVNNPLGATSAADALVKICEDAADELIQCPSQPLNELLPRLVTLAGSSPLMAVRVASLQAINCFILQDDTLSAHLGSLMAILSHAAASQETNSELRKVICQSLGLLMDAYPDELRPSMPAVLDYMLAMVQQRHDQAVALEACEFWLALAERDSSADLIVPLLPKLLPALVENVPYADDDAEVLEAEEEIGKEGVFESSEVRPRHHNVTVRGQMSFEKTDDLLECNHEEGEVSPEGSSDDDHNADSSVDYGNWTLRKCSAATVDLLSMTIDESDFIPIILPLINQLISSSDWKRQEAGILLLGAIGEGCSEPLKEHLSILVPFLANCVNNAPHVLVRPIAAWTISRYSSALSLELAENSLLSLFQGMTQHHSRAQQSICSAISLIAEKQPTAFEKAIPNGINALLWSLANYRLAKNLIVLYDVVGSIAVIESQGIRSQLGVVLPMLVKRLESINDKDDNTLLALLECLCSMSLAVHSSDLMTHASMLVQYAVNLASMFVQGDEIDICIVCLDLIGSIAQNLGNEAAHLLSPSLALVLSMAESPLPQFRQSAFALLGDFVVNCASPLLPFATNLLLLIEQNIDVMSENSSNGSAINAVWCLSEIIFRLPNMIQSRVGQFASTLIGFLAKYQEQHVQSGYLQNIAIALGRSMALLSPPPDHLETILPRWARIMSLVTDPIERETAWAPMVATLLCHPEMLDSSSESADALCKSISTFRNTSCELEKGFKSLVCLIKDKNILNQSNLDYTLILRFGL